MPRDRCPHFERNRICSKGVCCDKAHIYKRQQGSTGLNIEKAFDLLFGRIDNIERTQAEIKEKLKILPNIDSIQTTKDKLSKIAQEMVNTVIALEANTEGIDTVIRKMSSLTISVDKNSEELHQLGISGVPTRYNLNRAPGPSGNMRDRAENIDATEEVEDKR